MMSPFDRGDFGGGRAVEEGIAGRCGGLQDRDKLGALRLRQLLAPLDKGAGEVMQEEGEEQQ